MRRVMVSKEVALKWLQTVVSDFKPSNAAKFRGSLEWYFADMGTLDDDFDENSRRVADRMTEKQWAKVLKMITDEELEQIIQMEKGKEEKKENVIKEEKKETEKEEGVKEACDILQAYIDDQSDENITVRACSTWSEFRDEVAEYFDNPDYWIREFLNVNHSKGGETVRVTFKVTAKEKDILDKLKSVDNMSGYIKTLIKADIKNKKNILLISRGRYGKSTAVIHPESKEELLREIHYIAKGYHCDHDSVVGIVFNGEPDEDNIEEYAYDNAEFGSQNLLYTGFNCNDGLGYDEDKNVWIADDGTEYSSAEDYYIKETNADYSGEIAELFSCYSRK